MTRRCMNCYHRPVMVCSEFCLPCVEQVREAYRCGDCASDVVVLVATGLAGMYIHVLHDSTCPSWRAKRRDADRCCADHPERPRHT